MTRPNVNNGHCGLGSLAGRLELGLDDGCLAQRDGFRSGDGITSWQLSRGSRSLEWLSQVAWPLFSHLVISRVEEFLPFS